MQLHFNKAVHNAVRKYILVLTNQWESNVDVSSNDKLRLPNTGKCCFICVLTVMKSSAIKFYGGVSARFFPFSMKCRNLENNMTESARCFIRESEHMYPLISIYRQSDAPPLFFYVLTAKVSGKQNRTIIII